MQSFQYLHYGLAGVLGFVGTKMLFSDFYKVPVGVALGIVTGILAVSMLASYRAAKVNPVPQQSG